MPDFITEDHPIEGEIITPHMPMHIPLPDEVPYLSSIAVDDREVEEG